MMRMLSSSIPHHHGNEKLLSHQASSTGQSYAPQPFFFVRQSAILIDGNRDKESEGVRPGI